MKDKNNTSEKELGEYRKYFESRKHFGFPPSYGKSVADCFVEARRGNFRNYVGIQVTVKEFFNPIHPEIYLLPRTKYYRFLDVWGDTIGLEQMQLPFSSSSFYFNDDDENNVFYNLKNNPAMWRTGGVDQLGYLVPPPDHAYENNEIYYVMPMFAHTRWIHQLLTAAMIAVILARSGYTPAERAPIILAAGCHDIAMPAGGDSVKRVDPRALDEEVNFSWVLKHYGLDKEWKNRYNFNIDDAAAWVQGQGVYGYLIDIFDKISYTALDCYHTGMNNFQRIIDFCNFNPLVMDVWEDVCINPDRKQIYFASPSRLYNFLYLRALEHEDLLLNPRARALDFYLTKLVKKLYLQGKITKTDLLTQTGQWLEFKLRETCSLKHAMFHTPDCLRWLKFSTRKKMEECCRIIGPKNIDHVDIIKPFKTGIDWPVKTNGKIMPLYEALSRNRIRNLQQIAEKTAGYYVYFKNKDFQPLL